MDHITAQRTVRDYVCSICWGHLIYRLTTADAIVECGKHGTTHQGITRKSSAKRRRAENDSDAVEVKHLLKSIGILPKETASEEDSLKKLGF